MKLLITLTIASIATAARLDKYLPPKASTINTGLQTPLEPDSSDSGPYVTQSQNYAGTSKNYAGQSQNYAGTSKNYVGTSKNYAGQSQNYAGTSKNHAGQSQNYATQGRDFGSQSKNYASQEQSFDSQAASYAIQGQDYASQAQILRYENEIDDKGWHYAYETSDGTKVEQDGRILPGSQSEEGSLAVTGSFSYISDDGQTYTVTYTADENGFHPSGDHLPTPPPIPEEILKSLQLTAGGNDVSGHYDSQRSSYDADAGY